MQNTQLSFANKLDRFTKQREEWTRALQTTVTPSIEQTIRKLWNASELCVQMQPRSLDINEAYKRLFAMSRTWSDEEMMREMGEKKASDAEISLQMVVKSHATVLALSTARRCRQVISVPTIIKFYRQVLETCTLELSRPELFCTYDIDVRAKVRRWIDEIVRAQALAVVPVAMFAKQPSTEQLPHLREIQKQIERVEADDDSLFNPTPSDVTTAIEEASDQVLPPPPSAKAEEPKVEGAVETTPVKEEEKTTPPKAEETTPVEEEETTPPVEEEEKMTPDKVSEDEKTPAKTMTMADIAAEAQKEDDKESAGYSSESSYESDEEI